ncbi:MAG: flagellar biosynthesis protein [Oscillospiraceae bacterium]|nr:flagellar biosynthesis protein [Oscillospiraceae bacterium]
MIEKVSSQRHQQMVSTAQSVDRSVDFGALFQKEMGKARQGVEFSKHAISRAEERGIDITPDLIDQLRGSMIRAQAKGATNILAMDSEKAFIINVPKAKVITAITQDEMKENVFTNIDGAVFL